MDEKMQTELLDEYRKENVVLSRVLIKVANQLEKWANEALISKWSTHQTQSMRKLSVDIRHEAREAKFFRRDKK